MTKFSFNHLLPFLRITSISSPSLHSMSSVFSILLECWADCKGGKVCPLHCLSITFSFGLYFWFRCSSFVRFSNLTKGLNQNESNSLYFSLNLFTKPDPKECLPLYSSDIQFDSMLSNDNSYVLYMQCRREKHLVLFCADLTFFA